MIYLEKVSFRDSIRNMNYNVKLVFLFSFFTSFGRGIWMGNVLTAYIYFFSDKSNITVGQTSLAMGLTMTIFVFPSGILADRIRRDIMLKVASLVGIAGLAVIQFGNSITTIFVALAFWGLFQAITRPALESIFADSVESGKRTKIYSWVHLVRQLAQAIGPFANVAFFFIFGNEWTLRNMKNVMLIGIIITFASIIIMVFFNDNKSLGSSSESIEEEMVTTNNDVQTRLSSRLTASKATKLIPILLVGSNIIIGVGAGMTIKYFPQFFIEQYKLEPSWVQIIMGVTAIFTGLSALLAQRFSIKRGRPLIIFSVQLIATLCLFGIALYPNIWLLVPLFVARGALMNAGQPLSRSILMDVVPKKKRGKWNSLETFAWGFFWNFSALIGGYLVGDVAALVFWKLSTVPQKFLISGDPLAGIVPKFWLVFIVTACVYLVGIIPLLFLIPLVGKERVAE
jgi:MFS family permease